MRILLLSAAMPLLFLLPVGNVEADFFVPSHGCYKPDKPIRFNSQWERENFLNEVEMYKQCIQDFVEKQEREAENHTEAIKKAIRDWNDFVRYELN